MNTGGRYLYVELGRSLTESIIVALPVSVLCVGIFTPLYAIVISILIKRKERSLHSKATLTIISFSLLTSLGDLALQLAGQFKSLHCNLPLTIQCQSLDLVIERYLVTLISTLPLVFNDAVIIWRAWCIFGKQRWALALSVGLCGLSFFVALAYVSTISLEFADWSSGPPGPASYVHVAALDYAFFALSLLSNAVATSFIGWTLWAHLKFLRDNGMTKQKIFGVWHILVLLLDCGVIYLILQSAMFGLQFSAISASSLFEDNATMTSYIIFASLYRNISFVYPSLTILLIQEVDSVEVFYNSVVALQMSKDDVAHFL